MNFQPRHWTPAAYEQLRSLLNSDQLVGKIAVFDFDNTVLCRDIGDATMAALHQAFQPHNSAHAIVGSHAGLSDTASIDAAYEYLLSYATMAPGTEASAYVFAVQAMQGMHLPMILQATDSAWAYEQAAIELQTDTAVQLVGNYPQPFFYPEMVDLIGQLLIRGVDVWVVSASNVWTVRHLVLQYLNPRLQSAYGYGLHPEKVIGISMLIMDERSRTLHSDRELVQTNAAYAYMDTAELKYYSLSGLLSQPVSAYYGKTACIQAYIGSNSPWLVAGDSPNDLPMLQTAQNRLWITRLNKPHYLNAMLKINEKQHQANWIVQPTHTGRNPGFVADLNQLQQTKMADTETARNIFQGIANFR